MYKHHTSCRACSCGQNSAPAKIKESSYLGGSNHPGQRLIQVADFGVRPLANDFKSMADYHAGFAPLSVLFCPQCRLAQLSVVVDPKILYKDYPYVTSNTETMRCHFAQILKEMEDTLGRMPVNILEIGSNNGAFLRYCLDRGVKGVEGIEPDSALTRAANAAGVPTSAEFWPYITPKTSDCFDVIVARHVFAHCHDWRGFVSKAAEVMHENSVLWIEAPYVEDLLQNHQVDTIYHEHLSYINAGAITHLLKGTNLYLSDVKRYPLHGGSIGLVIRKRSWSYEAAVTPALSALLEAEKDLTPERWADDITKSNLLAGLLRDKVRELRGQGKTICGYGAPAKSSFWVQSCGFTRQDLAFITDDTPAKWYKLSPGTDIPIIDEGALLRELPDYAVMFPWNFAAEVVKRQARYLELGGKFIVPVPEVRIIEAS